ncbi:MAG: Hpt domain-containing protein, partial [Planctomycetaceae bacterium]|nr:Hpt domain-containing protein [Planctomycetaceae bacterium]
MSEENSADMLDCDAQLMEMFVANAADLLDEIESDLLKMEHMEGWDENLVNKVFRSAHTIKGESGFIGLEVIGKLAHSIENVLDNVRERVFVADGETINLLLDCFDELRKLTDDVDNSNDADVSKFVTQLDDLVARKIGGDSQTPAAQSPAEPACEEISTPDVTASKDTVSKDTVSEDTVSEDTPCEQATETIAVASPVPAKQLPGDLLIV